ncbi:hypothetical protein M3Y94_00512000 [Aphelenchoides besseyi]|nr:hypothetical protein M3Y94_00512000 [Aphelenchoides besseyi]
MWSSENWIEFMKKYCDNYPEENLETDSLYLAEEKIVPQHFSSLISIFDQSPNELKKLFPILLIGNLIALVDGMKRYVCEQDEPKSQTSSRNEGSSIDNTQPKKRRIEAPLSQISLRTHVTDWVDRVKKFVLYYHDKESKPPMRCAVAISPTMAAANFYGSNLQFTSRRHYGDDSNEDPHVIDLHFLYDKSKKPVKTKVVETNTCVDYILLEVIDGQKFFHGDVKDHIFEVPCVGQDLLAIGLPSESTNQTTITEGVILNDGPDYDHQMYARLVDCPADFGGGLFSRSNKFLGFVSNSCTPLTTKNYLTRTPFCTGK